VEFQFRSNRVHNFFQRGRTAKRKNYFFYFDRRRVLVTSVGKVATRNSSLVVSLGRAVGEIEGGHSWEPISAQEPRLQIMTAAA
jgi:hypothetical protein